MIRATDEEPDCEYASRECKRISRFHCLRTLGKQIKCKPLFRLHQLGCVWTNESREYAQKRGNTVKKRGGKTLWLAGCKGESGIVRQRSKF